MSAPRAPPRRRRPTRREPARVVVRPVHTGHAPPAAAPRSPSTTARSCAGVEVGEDEREVERQVQLVAPVAVEPHQLARGRARTSRPPGSARRVAPAIARQRRRRRAPRAGSCCTPAAARARGPAGGRRGVGGRVVAQLAVLDDRVRDVDPEARHAAVEPEAQDVVELLAHLLVPPVQVGLRRAGSCAGSTGPWPRRASTRAPPKFETSCWAATPSGRGSAHTYQSRWRASRRQRVPEPRVPVAGVVRDEVEQDADAARGRPRRPARRGPPACRGPGDAA